MRSVKVPKKTHRFRYLRNHNAKKRKTLHRNKANINNWISSVVTERDQHKIQEKRPLPLSAVVTAKPSCSLSDSKSLNKTVISNGSAKKKTVVPTNTKPTTTNHIAKEKPKKNVVESEKKQRQKHEKGNKTSKEVVSSESIVTTERVFQENDTAEGFDDEPMTIQMDVASETAAIDEGDMQIPSMNGFGDELMLDISANAGSLTASAPLTKCSIDSGVDVQNGNGTGNHNGNNIHTNNNGSTAESKEKSPVDGTTNGEQTETESESIVTRFEKHVFELVSIINERLEQKTIAASGTSANESLASPLLLEKAEPMERKREKKPRTYKLLPKDIEFCVYMMEKYGADHEGMSKDAKNVFHDPASMIARKLRIFRDSPHFEEYQQLKGNA